MGNIPLFCSAYFSTVNLGAMYPFTMGWVLTVTELLCDKWWQGFVDRIGNKRTGNL